MIKKIDFFLLTAILMLFSTIGFSQTLEHKFERITTNDGLAHSTVNCILQDRDGFMWFGSYGGLNKFDGYGFTTYANDPDDPNSLSLNGVVLLFQDHKGRIWISYNGEGGLDYLDPETDKIYHFKHDPQNERSLSSNQLYNVIQDNEKNIWVATATGIDKLIETKKEIYFEHYPYPEGLTSVTRIHLTNSQRFLVIGSEVQEFFPEENRYESLGINMGALQLNSLAEDADGNIYLGTIAQGVLKLAYNSLSKNYLLESNSEINMDPTARGCITIDHQGNFWIGTERKGLYKYEVESGKTEHFVFDELDDLSLSDNAVYCLGEDRSGLLWIGTFSQGICKYDLYSKKFYNFTASSADTNSLSGSLIASISSLSVNELWVGIRGDGGVNRLLFDGTEEVDILHYMNDPDNENSLFNNNVICLVQRQNGEVWIGGGFTKISRLIPEIPFSGEQPQFEHYDVPGWTFSIFEDSYGILWGGTWGAGLYRFHDETKTYTSYQHNPEDPKSICDNVIWSFYEDDFNNLWIGGNGNGLSILTKDQKDKENPEFINISFDKENKFSLSDNTVNVMFKDSRGSLWIGTNRGLNQLQETQKSIQNIKVNKNLKFNVYTSKDGLSSDAVVGIIEDQEGNLWISTTDGLSFFNLADTTFTNYYESDGLQSNEFQHLAYFKNALGRAFFGGKNGITTFYPEEIKANPFKPEIALTNLKVFNKTVDVGEVVNNDVILEETINNVSEIELSHKNNVFTIEFAALHFTQPEQNQYAYYLEGFEEDWNTDLESRSATYTNLDPGRYIFRVKGSNNNGLWNEEAKSIVIKVKAAWYNTWLFRILALIVIGLIVLYVIRMRMNSIKHEKEVLQEKLAEGQRELQVQKDEIEKQKLAIEEQNRNEHQIRYLHSGISKFTELIAETRKNVSELSARLITELVKYTETSAGVIYLSDETDPNNVQLLNSGSYCYDSTTLKDKVILPGEGNIGTCFNEKKVIQIDNLPDGYMELSSGLGKASLRHSVIVPIINENKSLGVIELAAREEIEPYKVEFVAKLMESFASVIAINKANSITQEMLEQNRIQSEELQAQEEELRQNLEEMEATQEELKRQMEASKKTNEKILLEQSLSNAFLENALEGVYFKDLESRFIKASNSMKDVFGVKNVEDIYGKTDFDFFTDEHAKPAFEDEQNIIKTGKPILNKIEKETHADGRVSYVTTTKMPLKDETGKIIGTFGISRNITELVEMKEDLERREKEMEEKENQIMSLQDEIRTKEKTIKELEKKLKS